MLFNTYTFACFLAVVFAAYLSLPLRGRQVFLLLASYVFYCWETPVYGLLLLTSTVLDYSCGRLMGRLSGQGKRRLVLLASICGNLGLLGFFKYGDFFAANAFGVARLFGFEGTWDPMGYILPVGISFYTFQTMSYTIQVYRGQIEPTRDPVSFALYVSFFPQLVAGPIERASNLLPQLQVFHRVTVDDVRVGLTRIVFGLFRKLVIADRLGILVDLFFENPDAFSTLTAWAVLPAFLAQIYLDFAGYADIAIGTARLFGIRLTENFRRPLLAVSIGDFWTRWHITLTSWLRDYVFNPLGGFRRGGSRALMNGWIVLLLCGLWHGAAWNFVIWGVYQATVVSLYFIWRFIRKKLGWQYRGLPGRLRPTVALSIAVTFCVSSLNTLFFRSPDFKTIAHVSRALCGRHGGAELQTGWYVWGFLGIIAAVLIVELLQEYAGLNARLRRVHWIVRTAWLVAVAVVTLLVSVNAATPYIYFQF